VLPTVIHCQRDRALIDRLGARYCYIGRPSRWGNPYSHQDDTLAQFKVATRALAIQAYLGWLATQPALLQALPELHGKVLGCWCVPRPCHGEILARLAARVVDAQGRRQHLAVPCTCAGQGCLFCTGGRQPCSCCGAVGDWSPPCPGLTVSR
jgi:Domain of unknown function (DUF4326)